MFKRILICGDRNWTDIDFMARAMIKWISKHGKPEAIIEGCARGADSLAGHEWASAYNQECDFLGTPQITIMHYPAQWEQHDSYFQTCWCSDKTTTKCRGAGPLRNQWMLTDGKPDAVIAFHTNIAESRGTADMVRRARAAGIPVWIPYPQPK